MSTLRLLVAVAWMLAASLAHASSDMSACISAYAKKSPDDQIRLYTLCITQGQLAKTDLASAFANRGVAYLGKGDSDHALGDFTKSVQFDPGYGLAYLNRAVIYLSRGQPEMAEADLAATLKNPPSRAWPQAHFYRGLALMSRGNCADAVSDFDAALKKDRKLVWGYAAKAWVLATCADEKGRNGADAVQAAQQALRLEDHWRIHDVLAAAYAESGRFEDGVRELKLAQEKTAASETASPWKAALQARLALYEAHQPYRQQADAASAGTEWLAAMD